MKIMFPRQSRQVLTIQKQIDTQKGEHKNMAKTMLSHCSWCS